jgi:hypothetical protein
MLASLPPNVRPHDIDRPVTRLDDASSDELWELANERQRDAIRDTFTSFFAGQITMDLSEGQVCAAHRCWMKHREEKLEAMVRDGLIH